MHAGLCVVANICGFFWGSLEEKKDTSVAMLAAQIRARIQKDNMEHSAAVERIEKKTVSRRKKRTWWI
jgi:hypothetical protein